MSANRPLHPHPPLPSPTSLAHAIRFSDQSCKSLARELGVSASRVAEHIRKGGFDTRSGKRLPGAPEQQRRRLKDSDSGSANHVTGSDRQVPTQPVRYGQTPSQARSFDWGALGPPPKLKPDHREVFSDPDPDTYVESPLPDEQWKPGVPETEHPDEDDLPEPEPDSDQNLESRNQNLDAADDAAASCEPRNATHVRSPGKLAGHTETIIRRYTAGESSPKIAADFGCTPAAITALLHRNNVSVRSRTQGQRQHYGLGEPPAPARPGEKVCNRCNSSKPCDDFPEHPNTKDGVDGTCRDCRNRRPPTEARAIRNRARNRAYAELITRHKSEWEQLLQAKTLEVSAEFDRIRAAAGPDGDAVPRLKPGPKRKSQSDVVERLDVARCRTCHTHHDSKHICPTCGDDTPENQPVVPPYLIREWARAQGIGPVPARGPLPTRLVRAYLEENGGEVDAS